MKEQQPTYGGEESVNNDDNSENQTPESGESGLDPQSKRISKNEKRLVQNRISAQRFRQKRKNEFENLKENFNTVLKDNEKLRNQVQELQTVINHQQESHAQQEQQMQAIQSQLTEIFCKQVITQQAIPGSVNKTGNVEKAQTPTQTYLKNVPGIENVLNGMGQPEDKNQDLMNNLKKLMDLQNSIQNSQQAAVPNIQQEPVQNIQTQQNSNQQNLVNMFLQQMQPQNQNKSLTDSHNGTQQNLMNAIMQLQNQSKPDNKLDNNNFGNIQQMVQRQISQQVPEQTPKLSTPGLVGMRASPLLKPLDVTSGLFKQNCFMNGSLTPRQQESLTPQKAKMSQPIVLVNDGQSQKSNARVTPRGNKYFEQLIHTKERLSSSNVSGLITPQSQIGLQNQSQFNISQISQLLQNVKNKQLGKVPGEVSTSNETHQNQTKEQVNKTFQMSTLNNCFSFNQLLTSNGNPITPNQQFQQQMGAQMQSDSSPIQVSNSNQGVSPNQES